MGFPGKSHGITGMQRHQLFTALSHQTKMKWLSQSKNHSQGNWGKNVHGSIDTLVANIIANTPGNKRPGAALENPVVKK